jgi:hypothetical protein
VADASVIQRPRANEFEHFARAFRPKVEELMLDRMERNQDIDRPAIVASLRRVITISGTADHHPGTGDHAHRITHWAVPALPTVLRPRFRVALLPEDHLRVLAQLHRLERNTRTERSGSRLDHHVDAEALETVQ